MHNTAFLQPYSAPQHHPQLTRAASTHGGTSLLGLPSVPSSPLVVPPTQPVPTCPCWVPASTLDCNVLSAPPPLPQRRCRAPEPPHHTAHTPLNSNPRVLAHHVATFAAKAPQYSAT